MRRLVLSFGDIAGSGTASAIVHPRDRTLEIQIGLIVTCRRLRDALNRSS